MESRHQMDRRKTIIFVSSSAKCWKGSCLIREVSLIRGRPFREGSYVCGKHSSVYEPISVLLHRPLCLSWRSQDHWISTRQTWPTWTPRPPRTLCGHSLPSPLSEEQPAWGGGEVKGEEGRGRKRGRKGWRVTFRIQWGNIFGPLLQSVHQQKQL